MYVCIYVLLLVSFWPLFLLLRVQLHKSYSTVRECNTNIQIKQIVHFVRRKISGLFLVCFFFLFIYKFFFSFTFVGILSLSIQTNRSIIWFGSQWTTLTGKLIIWGHAVHCYFLIGIIFLIDFRNFLLFFFFSWFSSDWHFVKIEFLFVDFSLNVFFFIRNS